MNETFQMVLLAIGPPLSQTVAKLSAKSSDKPAKIYSR